MKKLEYLLIPKNWAWGKMADRKAIFIVEDDPMIGMMLEDFLETLGSPPVAIAENLVLAEEKAKSVPFNASLLVCNLGTAKVWPVADYLMRPEEGRVGDDCGVRLRIGWWPYKQKKK